MPAKQPVTLDDHSKVVPRLPIPNRTVKRLCADDSGHSSVKVGHRQALMPKTPPAALEGFFYDREKHKHKKLTVTAPSLLNNNTITTQPTGNAPADLY
jgi:hypothetical protein